MRGSPSIIEGPPIDENEMLNTEQSVKLECVKCSHRWAISKSEQTALRAGNDQLISCPNCGN
jgi:Zn finger protein HypA/HybF involved in hydrogenase expression